MTRTMSVSTTSSPASVGGLIQAMYPVRGGAIRYEPGDLLIGNIRPYLRKAWLADRSGGASPDVLTISLNDRGQQLVLPRFLYFVIASDDFIAYSMQHAKGGKMPRGDKTATMRYEIPVPSRDEQERIVAILDKFDALVNDPSTGLQAELTARLQQYEHYLGRLLTFPEAA